ncbi:hypothetical protein GXW82_14425 [Streptacidiphilus sp. 4-A2]|nr:hypothetical protein [Streptacidiphilus sp. 4-A2]
MDQLTTPVKQAQTALQAVSVQPGDFYHANEMRINVNGPNADDGLKEQFIKVLGDLSQGLSDLSAGMRTLSAKYTTTEDANSASATDLQNAFQSADGDFTSLVTDAGAPRVPRPAAVQAAAAEPRARAGAHWCGTGGRPPGARAGRPTRRLRKDGGGMSSTDYNSGGFTQGGDGTVFGDPSSDPGSIQDYNTWDWKQIEAAINGMSAGVDNSANQEEAQSVSDPQSLQNAADIFYQVQVALSGVAQALTDQAKALAGDNGPWSGDAADSFLTMVDTFSKQITATADVLSGGTSGADSIPQQLANNAVNLQNAQQKISEIDTYYANEAVKSGVTPMSNGLIPISQRPQLVEWMDEDMRAVLKSLASEYQVTIDSVRSPGAINSPLGNNPPSTGDGPPDQPAFTDAGDMPPVPSSAASRSATSRAGRPSPRTSWAARTPARCR